MTHRIKVVLLLLFLSDAIGVAAQDPRADQFHQVDPAWLVTAAEAQQWAELKNANLPTFTGSPEWLNYMRFLEAKLAGYGVVDLMHNSWEFQRWDTSDDTSNWSLTSNGTPVRVANYGAYSGSTSPEGISAPLVYYDHDHPPKSIAGKIVVIPTRLHPQPPYEQSYLINYTYTDYEFRTSDATFPAPLSFVPPEQSYSFDIWYQLGQQLERIAIEGHARGAVIVYDMAYERTKGVYTFPVPQLYDAPTLILSREDGAQVIADAKAGKSATLRLQATVQAATAYQLIGYLPGKDYGTAADQQIVLVNHTDGPSITQDNGALGILAIIKYYAHIPQAQRPRTLSVYLDCRHYMPGMEIAHQADSWLNRKPQGSKTFVGLIHIEHLGEMDYREVGGEVQPTGLPEQSYLWTRNNPLLIDAAIRAVKKYGWARAQVSVPERAGIHGGPQQPWWGVGVIGMRDTGYSNCEVWRCLDLPGFGLGGFLGHYWTSDATIERWSNVLFRSQAATMIELTGVLMTSDLAAIKPAASADSYLQRRN